MFIVLKKCLIGASLVALAFSFEVGNANAATCQQLPSCASLGYDKTSCPSGIHSLVCPFDSTYLYCPDCTSYPLTKSQCNSSYGTCTACPYNSSLYQYSACATGKTKNSDGLCRCNTTTYRYVEPTGSAMSTCEDDTGTYTSTNKCWTNAKINTGSSCDRVTLSIGDVFTWGGAPLGIVLKDTGSKITIMSMFYVNSDGSEGVGNSSYMMGSDLSTPQVHYIPSVCTRNGSIVAPGSYRPNSQYDPICQNSSGWRLPTFEEALLMSDAGSSYLGNQMGTGTDVSQHVYNEIGGGSAMTKWFPNLAPAELNTVTVMDTGYKCYYSGKSLHTVNTSATGGSSGGCNFYDNSGFVTYHDCTGSCDNDRFPVRPVLDINI